MIIAPASQSVTLDIQIVDDGGLPVTGLLAATMPAIYYAREREAAVAITLSDASSVTQAYSSGRVFERSGSAGVYRLDVPDAAFATASRVSIYGEAADKRVIHPRILVRNVEAQTVGINANAITTAAFADGAITAAKIAGNAITLAKVASDLLTAIANEVEAQIIDETDSEKVLTAITDKIAAANPSLQGLTLAAMAAAVRTELATELARLDEAVSAAKTLKATERVKLAASQTDYAPAKPGDIPAAAEVAEAARLLLERTGGPLKEAEADAASAATSASTAATQAAEANARIGDGSQGSHVARKSDVQVSAPETPPSPDIEFNDTEVTLG